MENLIFVIDYLNDECRDAVEVTAIEGVQVLQDEQSGLEVDVLLEVEQGRHLHLLHQVPLAQPHGQCKKQGQNILQLRKIVFPRFQCMPAEHCLL